MADKLLPYYEKELAYLRESGQQFAKENPNVAQHLGIAQREISDPHVAQLVEAFAYLNARIHHRLDDQFPELTKSLTDTLLPHYQRPLPSMSIVQLEPDAEQLTGHYRIDQGTLLHLKDHAYCQFQTTQPVDLWPVTLFDLQYQARPFNTPGAEATPEATSVLKIALKTTSRDIQFSDLSIDKLVFYITDQSQRHALFELLFNQCADIVVSSSNSTDCFHLGAKALQATGFNSQHTMLPQDARVFYGYQLLTEYFAYPEKFCFFQLTGLVECLSKIQDQKADIYCYFNQQRDLQHIKRHQLKLHCSPVINLFKQRADPVKLNEQNTDYEIQADGRQPQAYEIYSIDRVYQIQGGQQETIDPLYRAQISASHDHHSDSKPSFNDLPAYFWTATRKSAKHVDKLKHRDEASTMFISLLNLHHEPARLKNTVLGMETTCSNRFEPVKLTANQSQIEWQSVSGSPPCSGIFSIQPLTANVQPPDDTMLWQMLSHLNLNLSSMGLYSNSLDSFKDMLRLYNFNQSSFNQAAIDSIVRLQAKSLTAPLTIDGQTFISRGIEIEITLDEQQLTGISTLLFVLVIDHFMGLYTSVNSFTRVKVKMLNQEGLYYKGPLRTGQQERY